MHTRYMLKGKLRDFSAWMQFSDHFCYKGLMGTKVLKLVPFGDKSCHRKRAPRSSFGTKVPPKCTSAQSAALSDSLKINYTMMERIHTEKQNWLLHPSLDRFHRVQRCLPRGLAGVVALQEESGGTVSERWEDQSLLCWATEGIA